ncbi:MAG: hypothetical protein ABI970_17955 [Chloroflexota bacterium]
MMTDLILHITEEQRQRIENIAQQRGYKAPDDYLLALFELDAEDDDFEEDPVAAFRQSWHEAMTGQTYPIATLWDNMDDE